MGLIKLVFILLLIKNCCCHLSCRLSDDNDEHDDDITIRGSSRATLQRSVGPPGKQGPRGPPGDVTQCQCPINEERIRGLESTILGLQKKIACSGVVYEDSCIRLLYTRGSSVATHTLAEEQCRSNGSTLAEIRNDQLFYDVYAYIKQAWITYTTPYEDEYVNIWLAMKYQNNKIVFDNGDMMDVDSIGFWRKSNPVSNADRVFIALHVAISKDRKSGAYGLFNVDESWGNPVPLCQFPL